MPNPKVGTVTADVTKAVARAQGRPRRVPRREGGHHPDARSARRRSSPRRSRRTCARCSSMLMKLKPATAKGTYMRSITISTTHGPGVKIDTDAVHRRRSSSQIDRIRPRRRSRHSISPAETSGRSHAASRPSRLNEGSSLQETPWKEHKKNKSSARSRRRGRTSPRSSSPTTAASPCRSSPTMRDDFRKAGCPLPRAQELARQDRGQGLARWSRSPQLMVGTTAVIWTTDEAPQPPAKIALKWAKDRAQVHDQGRLLRGPGPRRRRRRDAREDAGQERDPRLDADDVPRGAAELRRAAHRRPARTSRTSSTRASASSRAAGYAAHSPTQRFSNHFGFRSKEKYHGDSIRKRSSTTSRTSPSSSSSTLTKALEDKWGVKAAPVAVAAAAGRRRRAAAAAGRGEDRVHRRPQGRRRATRSTSSRSSARSPASASRTPRTSSTAPRRTSRTASTRPRPRTSRRSSRKPAPRSRSSKLSCPIATWRSSRLRRGRAADRSDARGRSGVRVRRRRSWHVTCVALFASLFRGRAIRSPGLRSRLHAYPTSRRALVATQQLAADSALDPLSSGSAWRSAASLSARVARHRPSRAARTRRLTPWRH